MAEGFLKAECGEHHEIFSAGTDPHGLNPLAVETMAEIGIDITGHTSDPVEAYGAEQFDYVITVCDHARESCPVFPGGEQLHWSFDDPAAATGTKEERLPLFRSVRDEIGEAIREFLRHRSDAGGTRY